MADTEKPNHPGDPPGPQATEAERHAYAQANGRWSDWIKLHPEDADPAPVSIAMPLGEEPQGNAP